MAQKKKTSAGSTIASSLGNWAGQVYSGVSDAFKSASATPAPSMRQAAGASRVQSALKTPNAGVAAKNAREAAGPAPYRRPEAGMSYNAMTGMMEPDTNYMGVTESLWNPASRMTQAATQGGTILGTVDKKVNNANSAFNAAREKMMPGVDAGAGMSYNAATGMMEPDSFAAKPAPPKAAQDTRQYRKAPGEGNAVFGPAAIRQQDAAAARSPYQRKFDAEKAKIETQRQRAASIEDSQVQQALSGMPFPFNPADPTMGEGADRAGGSIASQIVAEMLTPNSIGELASGAATLRKGLSGVAGSIAKPLQAGYDAAAWGVRGAQANRSSRASMRAAEQAYQAANPVTARAAAELKGTGKPAAPEATVSGQVVEPPPNVPLSDRDVVGATALTPYNQRTMGQIPGKATSLDTRSFPTGRYRSVRKAPTVVASNVSDPTIENVYNALDQAAHPSPNSAVQGLNTPGATPLADRAAQMYPSPQEQLLGQGPRPQTAAPLAPPPQMEAPRQGLYPPPEMLPPSPYAPPTPQAQQAMLGQMGEMPRGYSEQFGEPLPMPSENVPGTTQGVSGAQEMLQRNLGDTFQPPSAPSQQALQDAQAMLSRPEMQGSFVPPEQQQLYQQFLREQQLKQGKEAWQAPNAWPQEGTAPMPPVSSAANDATEEALRRVARDEAMARMQPRRAPTEGPGSVQSRRTEPFLNEPLPRQPETVANPGGAQRAVDYLKQLVSAPEVDPRVKQALTHIQSLLSAPENAVGDVNTATQMTRAATGSENITEAAGAAGKSGNATQPPPFTPRGPDTTRLWGDGPVPPNRPQSASNAAGAVPAGKAPLASPPSMRRAAEQAAGAAPVNAAIGPRNPLRGEIPFLERPGNVASNANAVVDSGAPGDAGTGAPRRPFVAPPRGASEASQASAPDASPAKGEAGVADDGVLYYGDDEEAANRAFDNPDGVQYAGTAGNGRVGRRPPRERRFAPGGARPADAAGVAGDAPAGPQYASGNAASAPVTPPASNAPKDPTVVPVSEQQVVRDVRQVTGMIQRGQTKRASIWQSVADKLEGNRPGRIVFNDELPAGARAAYHDQRRLVEIRRPNKQGAEAVYHELGHVVQHNSPIIQNATPAMISELEKLGDPSFVRPTKTGIGPSASNGNVAYQRGEGLAEFSRLWAQFPNEAKLAAPELSKAWEKYLDESGEIGKRMRQVQADVQAREVATDEALFRAKHMREERSKKLESASETDGAIQQVADRFHPLRKMERDAKAGGAALTPDKQPYILATMMRSRAANYAKDEMSRLHEIVAPMKTPERVAEFEEYLVARHFEDMRKDAKSGGLLTGTTEAENKAILAKHANNQEFKDAAEKLYEFQADQVKMAVKMKLISQDQADAMFARWPNYVPTKRFYELAAAELPVKGSGRMPGSSLQHSDPFQKLTGSEREWLSPLTSIVENTANIRLQALKNEVGLAVAELYDKQAAHIGDYVSEVDAPDAAFDLAKSNVLRVNDGGKMRYFQLSPSLFRSLTEEASLKPGILTKINQAWGKILRPLATTYNPGFSIANAIRDTFTLPFVARTSAGRVPFMPFAEGAAIQVKAAKGDAASKALMREFELSGGAQNFGDSLIDRAVADTEKVNFTPTPARKAWSRLKHRVASVAQFSEQSNRVGHYARAKRYYRAKNPSWTDEQVQMMAAFEARDTLDFSRRGSSDAVRRLRQNVPFIGAHIEGTRKVVEAMVEQPLQVLKAGVAMGLAPEAIALWQNRDDPDFWEIPQSLRDKYIYLRNPAWDGENVNNKFIPIPRVPGVFAMFGRGAEWAYQGTIDNAPKGQRAKEMLSTLSHDLLPGDVDPTTWSDLSGVATNLAGLAGPAAKAGAEIASKTNFYWQSPIISKGAQRRNASPHNQTSGSSSVLAQVLADALHKGSGGFFNESPMMIDHVIRSLTAGAGQTAINNVIDPALAAVTGRQTSDTRTASSVGGAAVDSVRGRYKPSGFTSVTRLDKKVEALARAEDDAGAAEPSAELKKLQKAQKEVAALLMAFNKEKAPAKKAMLKRQILKAADSDKQWSIARRRLD